MATSDIFSGSASPYTMGTYSGTPYGPGLPKVGSPSTGNSSSQQKAIAKRVQPKAPTSVSNVNRTVGSNSVGSISPTAPSAPTIDEWLASDTAYKSASDQLAKALADYKAQASNSENQYRADYTNKIADLSKARDLGMKELEADFASRGMLGSGLYAQAYNDGLTSWNNRQRDLDKGLADFLTNLATQTNNFQSEQQITSEKAKQDAIARRAASLGL